MGKRFRKHRKKIYYNSTAIPIKPNKQIKYYPPTCITKEIIITEEDKIIYVYEIDHKRHCTKVVNVSYQTFIDGKWISIIRFDSEHGKMHCHKKPSLYKEEFTTTVGVIQRGNPHKWLTWAIEDTKDRYLDYKRSFLKRSKIIPIDRRKK
jgi:hypothetical protein